MRHHHIIIIIRVRTTSWSVSDVGSTKIEKDPKSRDNRSTAWSKRMDSILFSTVSMATAAWKKQRLNAALNDDVFTVDKDNKPLAPKHSTVNGLPWYRATFILIMYEPPHLFYEPKEWSETTVLLLQRNDEDHNKIWTLPGGPVPFNTTYEASAIQHLQKHHKIDVCAPQNCLHHLFTFPLGFEAPRNGYAGVWGDFYEVKLGQD
jgi:hypothetical protein